VANINVKIPTPFRKFTAGEATVAVEGGTIAEALESLESKHPGVKAKLCDDSGKLRRFINVYANQDDIRFLDNLDTELGDGDEVTIVPAIAGG
jgi:molybdopterin synthase sulfur carrier subunit